MPLGSEGGSHVDDVLDLVRTAFEGHSAGAVDRTVQACVVRPLVGDPAGELLGQPQRVQADVQAKHGLRGSQSSPVAARPLRTQEAAAHRRKDPSLAKAGGSGLGNSLSGRVHVVEFGNELQDRESLDIKVGSAVVTSCGFVPPSVEVRPEVSECLGTAKLEKRVHCVADVVVTQCFWTRILWASRCNGRRDETTSRGVPRFTRSKMSLSSQPFAMCRYSLKPVTPDMSPRTSTW